MRQASSSPQNQRAFSGVFLVFFFNFKNVPVNAGKLNKNFPSTSRSNALGLFPLARQKNFRSSYSREDLRKLLNLFNASKGDLNVISSLNDNVDSRLTT